MLVNTDDCVRMVFVWEETGLPGGNPPVLLGDHMAMSWLLDCRMTRDSCYLRQK